MYIEPNIIPLLNIDKVKNEIELYLKDNNERDVFKCERLEHENRKTTHRSVWFIIGYGMIVNQGYFPYLNTWLDLWPFSIKPDSVLFNKMVANSYVESHIDPRRKRKLMIPIIEPEPGSSYFEYHYEVYKINPTGERYYNYPGKPYLIDTIRPHSITSGKYDRTLLWLIFNESYDDISSMLNAEIK